MFVIQFAIDGFGHHALAEQWTNAPTEEQASLARLVERLEVLLQGPAFAWTALLWGIPLVLFGLALVLDQRSGSWLGWVGLLLGIVFFTAGAARFLQFSVAPDGLVFAASTLGAALWGFALGIAMWRTPGRQVACGP